MHDFVASRINHLENMIHWVVQSSQMLTYFIMPYLKIIFIDITVNLPKKAFKYWELVDFLEAFQNSNFPLEA